MHIKGTMILCRKFALKSGGGLYSKGGVMARHYGTYVVIKADSVTLLSMHWLLKHLRSYNYNVMIMFCDVTSKNNTLINFIYKFQDIHSENSLLRTSLGPHEVSVI